MSIEQIKEDVYVRTKLVELRIRTGEVIVTRLFSQQIHHPLVLFSIHEDLITPCSPTKVKVTDSVEFETDSSISGRIKTNGSDALLVHLVGDNKVGFMFPSVKASCFFDDQTDPIDKRFTTMANFKGHSDDPAHQKLSLPMLNLSDHNSYLSVQSDMNRVQFCHFVHNHEPYFNVVGEKFLNVALRCFGSHRAAISSFYSKYGYVQPLPVSGHLDLFQKKRALYINAPLEDAPVLPHIIEASQSIQRTLDDSQVKNCVIGSLAVAIHRPGFSVQDVDIAVDNLAMAEESLKKYDVTTASTGKWTDCAFRIMSGGTQFDVVELNRFEWDSVMTSKGLRILNERGLLFMKLMGEFERSLMQPNYDVFKIKNRKSILSLFDKASFVYPFFADFLQLNAEDNFRQLKTLVDGAAWDMTNLTTTFPLHANAFVQGKETFIPVVNSGSPCDGKIWIDKPIKSASWVALNGNDETCPISACSNITLPVVENVGILVCQNA